MVKRILILLDRFHWLWLTLASPFLFFPSPKWSPVRLVVPPLLLIRWKGLKGKQETNPGNIPSFILQFDHWFTPKSSGTIGYGRSECLYNLS
jgi:hypothetical protein